MNTKKQKMFSLCCFVRKRKTTQSEILALAQTQILNAIAKGPEELAKEIELSKSMNTNTCNSDTIVCNVFDENENIRVYLQK